MGKTEYEKLKEDIAAKVQAAGGTRYSKSDLTQMTMSMLNAPDYEVNNYIDNGETPVVTKPVERYRNSLKPMLKQFGVDAAELDKVQTVQFTKDHAEAVNDMAMQIVKDYTSTGRKLILPINAPDEAQMEISQQVVAEKEESTKKITETSPGVYEQVPTGKKKKTKKHKRMKVSNKVPAWLVDEYDI